MTNFDEYRCPACDEISQIDICALVWVRTYADGTDADGSHYFDGASKAVCVACGHKATVDDFSCHPAVQEGGAL